MARKKVECDRLEGLSAGRYIEKYARARNGEKTMSLYDIRKLATRVPTMTGREVSMFMEFYMASYPHSCTEWINDMLEAAALNSTNESIPKDELAMLLTTTSLVPCQRIKDKRFFLTKNMNPEFVHSDLISRGICHLTKCSELTDCFEQAPEAP